MEKIQDYRNPLERGEIMLHPAMFGKKKKKSFPI